MTRDQREIHRKKRVLEYAERTHQITRASKREKSTDLACTAGVGLLVDLVSGFDLVSSGTLRGPENWAEFLDLVLA